MLNFMRNGERKENRIRIDPYSKEVQLSFFHEIEDPRRIFQKHLIDLSQIGLSFKIKQNERETYEIGDYLRIHPPSSNKNLLARVCYIKKIPQSSDYRIGVCLV